jgi:GDP-4-dehydro-6-deoxy-D-mannose reductase
MSGPILVTGANGFLARHLLAKLKAMSTCTIIGTDVQASPSWTTNLDGYEPADLTSRHGVAAVLDKWQPNRVFHLAGLNKGSAWDLFAVNTLGTVGLLEAVIRIVPEARVLLIGSAAEYGPVKQDCLPVREDQPCKPLGAYGVSKHAATLAALDQTRRTGLHVTVARLFNLVGAGISRDLMVGAFLERARSALSASNGCPVVQMGRLDAKRDYLAVEDAASGCIQLMENGSSGDVVNLCSGVPMEVEYLVRTLCSFSSVPIRVDVSPDLVNAREVPVIYGDLTRARTMFGFTPRTSIAKALQSAWDHAMASPVNQ